MEAFGRPVVSLDSGYSPDNPPCPTCGEPLFGWALLRPHSTPVRRCELCGMAVAGDVASPDEARARLAEAAASGSRLPNRRSVQASIGGSGWSLLEYDSRFAFTEDAVERLGMKAGRPRLSVLSMWQTTVNSFTFGHNVLLGWLGRAKPTPGRGPTRQTVDAVVSVLIALPLLILAVLLEGLAWLLGRGGELTVEPTHTHQAELPS